MVAALRIEVARHERARTCPVPSLVQGQQVRVVGDAVRHHMRAPRVEAAALRPVERAGGVAADAAQAGAQAADLRDRVDQRLRVRVARLLEDLPYVADLD